MGKLLQWIICDGGVFHSMGEYTANKRNRSKQKGKREKWTMKYNEIQWNWNLFRYNKIKLDSYSYTHSLCMCMRIVPASVSESEVHLIFTILAYFHSVSVAIEDRCHGSTISFLTLPKIDFDENQWEIQCTHIQQRKEKIHRTEESEIDRVSYRIL